MGPVCLFNLIIIPALLMIQNYLQYCIFCTARIFGVPFNIWKFNLFQYEWYFSVKFNLSQNEICRQFITIQMMRYLKKICSKIFNFMQEWEIYNRCFLLKLLCLWN